MSVKFCEIIFLFLFSGFSIGNGFHIPPEKEGILESFIKSQREEIFHFFSHVQCVNFIVDVKRSPDLQFWFKFFDFLVVEFNEVHSFTILTDELATEDEEYWEKFFRRDWEVEREGFVIGFRLPDTLPVELEKKVFRDNAYYLMIVEEDSVDEKEVLSSCKTLWRRSGSVAVLVVFKRQLWIFNPFGTRERNRYGTLDTYKRHADLKKEILKDLNGYPLRLEFFESGYNTQFYRTETSRPFLRQFIGPDAITVEIMRNIMNFTGVFQTPEKPDAFGAKLDNGTFTGCLGKIINKKSDIGVTGFFIKDYLSPEIGFSSAIYQDELCLISRKASRIPQSLLPLLCFELDLWLCLFFTILFAALFWSSVRALNKRIIAQERVTPTEYLQIGIDTVMLSFSAPLRKFPRNNSERSFTASICLLSLVFVSIFQSSLSNVFIKPLFYKDIQTLAELADTKLVIYVKYAAMMQDMFPVNSTGVIGRLHDQMRQVGTTSSIMAQLAVSGDFVTVTRRCSLHQDNAFYFSARKLHMIPECPRKYNLAFLMRATSVYQERINDILLKLNNGGFHEMWIRDMIYHYSWSVRLKYGSFHEDPIKVLTLNDLQMPFYILAIGFSASAVVLLAEWMVVMYVRCKRD